VALEELRKARIKRQDSMHIFVMPRLFTTKWLNQIFKAKIEEDFSRPGSAR
jgi:hypothetical protein